MSFGYTVPGIPLHVPCYAPNTVQRAPFFVSVPPTLFHGLPSALSQTLERLKSPFYKCLFQKFGRCAERLVFFSCPGPLLPIPRFSLPPIHPFFAPSPLIKTLRTNPPPLRWPYQTLHCTYNLALGKQPPCKGNGSYAPTLSFFSTPALSSNRQSSFWS